MRYPPPGDLLKARVKLSSPALAGGFFTIEPPGKLGFLRRIHFTVMICYVTGHLLMDLTSSPSSLLEVRDRSSGLKVQPSDDRVGPNHVVGSPSLDISKSHLINMTPLLLLSLRKFHGFGALCQEGDKDQACVSYKSQQH